MRRVLFVCATGSVRGDIAAKLVREHLAGRVEAHVASSDSPEADLIVVLGTDTTAAKADTPVWQWDIAEPVDTLRDAHFDGMQHALRVARLGLEARLSLLELPLPEGSVIEPAAELDIVEAHLGETLVARAVFEQVDGFATLALEASHGDLALALIADRLAVARLLAIHTVYAVGDAELLGRAGFTSAPSLPANIASAFAARSESRGVLALQLADSKSTDELLDADIARELAANGTIAPPWMKRPDLPRPSMGWRMGSGEWYLWMWRRWWDALSSETRAAYIARWQASAPAEWLDWLAP